MRTQTAPALDANEQCDRAVEVDFGAAAQEWRAVLVDFELVTKNKKVHQLITRAGLQQERHACGKRGGLARKRDEEWRRRRG